MDKTEAENLKVQIIERRNYFSQLDHPLKYSKAQLHSGMQGRVVRQEDKRYMSDVRKGKATANKNLNTINNYISDLNTYDNRPMPVADPQGDGMQVMSTQSAPIAPAIKLTPKMQKRRQVRRSAAWY